MAHPTASGTLLLIGVAFLSLNALAVSARPGDLSAAEITKTVAVIPELTSSSGAEAAVAPIAIPAPWPALNATLTTPGRLGDSTLPANLTENLAVHPVSGFDLPSDAFPPVTSGPGAIPPVQAPSSIPPVTPDPGKLTEPSIPPRVVDPVEVGR